MLAYTHAWTTVNVSFNTRGWVGNRDETLTFELQTFVWYEILNYVFVASFNDNKRMVKLPERESGKKLLWNRLGLMWYIQNAVVFFSRNE